MLETLIQALLILLTMGLTYWFINRAHTDAKKSLREMVLQQQGMILRLEKHLADSHMRLSSWALSASDPESRRYMVGAVAQDISTSRLAEAQEAMAKAQGPLKPMRDDSDETVDPETRDPSDFKTTLGLAPDTVVDDESVARFVAGLNGRSDE